MDLRVGEPLFFGSDQARLFGCVHRPTAMPITHAALLLPAAGHEYASSHRSLRQLAVRLAERGCLALRMDMRGCGDSSGEKDSGDLGQWHEDAEHGLELLTECAPGADLRVVGLRLGASIALELGARRAATGQPLTALALWDPVLDGAEYLHAALSLQERRHGMRQQAEDRGPFEVMGHRWSSALADELRNLLLGDSGPAPAAKLLRVDTRAALDSDFGERWRTQGVALAHRAMQAPDLWSGDGQVALIPTAVVQTLAEWLVPA